MIDNQLYSIVFVHGWKADAKHPGWISTQFICWPERFIPAKVPEARILAYNYDCKLDEFWSEEDDIITDHSNEMMDLIIEQRMEGDQGDRPVIFVAHCLGGLVVENALVHGSHHDDRKNLVGCVRGVILLATPHYQPSTLSQVNKYFLLAGEEPLSDDELNSRSKWVLSIPRDFARLRSGQMEVDILCFYEGTAMMVDGAKVKIVEMSLARLPGAPEAERLAADHMRMAQIESGEDRDIAKLVRVLKRWVAKILPPSEKKNASTRVNNVSKASFDGSHNYGIQMGQNSGSMSGIKVGK
ncbi:hypothetical protein BO94DRAFT_226029 [Aspergillus sclerotioniger CBS 115572]|uniref:Fungal death-pathway protein SesB domain-containing protein n=1 Tax=Aspergillus sclerotioniger CBS 115572 TaxID=1450535 RepID=A0A317XEJ1_9EURO|nr:hypothetical protein BO94DRAFT_226029 [Aspergillus sclerotioniger CBS 115572]PWY95368.1 hypothetical protein BO94DRAFT_226029 [Aspergillus sclerotioniger CBS 115572]